MAPSTVLVRDNIITNLDSILFNNSFITTYTNLEEPKKSKMQTLNSMMKRLLAKDIQTLYKACYLNGDLKLTDKGKEVLMAILFQQPEVKKALITQAQEEIDEEEKIKNRI